VGGGDAGTVARRWPLVGRDDELALATEALAKHRSVVLTGPAGVGKTRLAHELADRITVAGTRTEWISATEAAAQVPLGAAAHLVPSAAIAHGRDATLRGIVAAFERERERGPLLLGVDDAHLLDDASAALVHLLATTGAASLVATVRSGEPMPDAIVSLWKDGHADLIALQSLARHEVEELVCSVLAGPIEGTLLQSLWETSKGNALYLHELVQHGLESGSLRAEQGLWRSTGGMQPGDRLQRLIGLRMGRLAEEERLALEYVAVGEPLPVSCLRAIHPPSVIDRLERRGLLSSQRSQQTSAVQIGLGHPLFGEVLLAEMTHTRLDDIRLRLADALEPLSTGNPADQFRVVLWRADSGDRSRPDQLRAAARRAWALWAAPVAERLARAALESGPDLEAGYLLAEAISDQGRSQEALEVWEALEGVDGPDLARAPAAMGHSSELHYHFGRPAEAEAVLRRAEARVTDPEALRLLRGALAMFDATSGRHRSHESVTSDAPSAALAAAIESATRGQFDVAEGTATQALATSDVWGDQFPTVALLLRLVTTWARAMAGRIREAELEAQREYATAIAEHLDYPRVTWCLIRGYVCLLRGLPGDASRALREGIVVTGDDDRGWIRPMHAYMAMAAALECDPEMAERHDRLAVDFNRSLDGVFGVDVRRAHAWVLVARGETTAALHELEAAAEEAASRGQSAFESFALHDIARFGGAADVVERLAALASVVDGELVDVFAAHARALAESDAGALERVSSHFAGIDLDLFAAEASAEAARAHRNDGRKASSYAALDRARELARRCQSAHTLALAWAHQPDELTGREREVAELAASGLSSRDIATRLDIAIRTVDNLLGRVYVKLAISGRQELVGLLGRRHLRE
jgi:DNA-binding CsgD family transcriptional regulator